MAATDLRPLAVVTGGTRGIGLGIASALVQDGWNLAIAGLRPRDAVERVIGSLADQGGAVHYVQADVGQAADRARLVAEVESWGPRS
jgi:3-oxoacyl-[acyl-carrier protein] reductase